MFLLHVLFLYNINLFSVDEDRFVCRCGADDDKWCDYCPPAVPVRVCGCHNAGVRRPVAEQLTRCIHLACSKELRAYTDHDVYALSRRALRCRICLHVHITVVSTLPHQFTRAHNCCVHPATSVYTCTLLLCPLCYISFHVHITVVSTQPHQFTRAHHCCVHPAISVYTCTSLLCPPCHISLHVHITVMSALPHQSIRAHHCCIRPVTPVHTCTSVLPV